jgi:hypothetical protein
MRIKSLSRKHPSTLLPSRTSLRLCSGSETGSGIGSTTGQAKFGRHERAYLSQSHREPQRSQSDRIYRIYRVFSQFPASGPEGPTLRRVSPPGWKRPRRDETEKESISFKIIARCQMNSPAFGKESGQVYLRADETLPLFIRKSGRYFLFVLSILSEEAFVIRVSLLFFFTSFFIIPLFQHSILPTCCSPFTDDCCPFTLN